MVGLMSVGGMQSAMRERRSPMKVGALAACNRKLLRCTQDVSLVNRLRQGLPSATEQTLPRWTSSAQTVRSCTDIPTDHVISSCVFLA
jgi:hypothetical protein